MQKSSVYVFTHPLGDCTNNGLTSRHTNLDLYSNVTKEEAKDIKKALELYETRLKGVSFLPQSDHGYVQAPYIPITEAQYKKMSEKVKPLKIKEASHEVTEKFCDGDSCQIKIGDKK
jgi:hypothetical protein